MGMVKWDPLQELNAMQERMNRLFELSRGRVYGAPLAAGGWQPAVDIYEDAAEVVVKMELPEVDQKDIDVRIEEQTLIIEGERRLEREEARHNYLRIERSYGPFHRTFSLPASVDQDQVHASCEMGVLKIVLPKKPSAKARQVEVE